MVTEKEIIDIIYEEFWPNDYEGAFWQNELKQAARRICDLVNTPRPLPQEITETSDGGIRIIFDSPKPKG